MVTMEKWMSMGWRSLPNQVAETTLQEVIAVEPLGNGVVVIHQLLPVLGQLVSRSVASLPLLLQLGLTLRIPRLALMDAGLDLPRLLRLFSSETVCCGRCREPAR